MNVHQAGIEGIAQTNEPGGTKGTQPHLVWAPSHQTNVEHPDQPSMETQNPGITLGIPHHPATVSHRPVSMMQMSGRSVICRMADLRFMASGKRQLDAESASTTSWMSRS